MVILSSSVYFMMPEKVKIDIQKTRTLYSVWENESWVLAATEYTNLYDGTKKMRAIGGREIIYWNDSDKVYAQRKSIWKENITTIQTYVFEKYNKDITNLPIENNFECFNCEDKIVHYEIRDILYDGETKEIESPFSFGNNMKIEWENGYYSKVFQQKVASDKIIIKYRPTSSYEVYNVRLFDPPKKQELQPQTNLQEWTYEIINEDEYINVDVNIINSSSIILNYSAKKTIPKNYTWGVSLCSEETDNATKVYTDRILTKTTTKEDWCKETNNKGYEILKEEKRSLPYSEEFKIDTLKDSFYLYGGQNSFTVVFDNVPSEGTRASFEKHVFYNQITSRWHLFFINNSRIVTMSSNNQSNWTDEVQISGGQAFAQNEFNCISEQRNTSSSYIHCVYTPSTIDSLFYKRILLTDTSPFVSLGAEQTPFDSSSQGGNGNDDIDLVSIAIDSDNCTLMVFDLEDDSEITGDEHELVMIKEANNATTTCGDGIFEIEDTKAGFPIFSIQSSAGYNSPFPVSINSYGDLDAQLTWVDSDSTTAFVYLTAFFNGSTDNIEGEVVLDTDVEGGGNFHNLFAIIVGDNSIAFGADDGTRDTDAYILVGKNSTTVTQVDTGIDQPNGNNDIAKVTATLDTRTSPNSTIWLFVGDDGDEKDIFYSKSNDSGFTWFNQTLWVDDGGRVTLRHFSSFFTNDTCDIMVKWESSNTAPRNVSVQIINTESCGVVEETVPVVNLRSPENNSVVVSNPIDFIYNVTATTGVDNCSLIIDGVVNLTDVSITLDINQTFQQTLANADYLWNVNCTNSAGTNTSQLFNLSVNVAVDTCSPSSPLTSNHQFLCSDNCVQSSILDAGGFNISIFGTGTFIMNSNITNYGSEVIKQGTSTSNMCNITCLNGCFVK